MKKIASVAAVSLLATAIASQAAAETLVYKKADYSGQVKAEVFLFDQGASNIDMKDDDNNNLNHLTLKFMHRYFTGEVKSQLQDGGDLTLENVKYDDGTLVFGQIGTISKDAANDDVLKLGMDTNIGINYKLADSLTVQVAGNSDGAGTWIANTGDDEIYAASVLGYNRTTAALAASYSTSVAGADVKASGQVKIHDDKTWNGTENTMETAYDANAVASASTSVAGADLKGGVAFATDVDDLKVFARVDYAVDAIGGKVYAQTKTGETYAAGVEAKVAMVEAKAGTWKPAEADAGMWVEVKASQDVAGANVWGGYKFEKHDGQGNDGKEVGGTLDYAWVGAKYSVTETVTVGAEMYDILRVADEGQASEAADAASVMNAKVFAEVSGHDASIYFEAWGLLDGFGAKVVTGYSF